MQGSAGVLRHEKLVAWQRADDLFIELHRLAGTFPDTERVELAAQLRRAAFSVPANIVEGFGRQHPRERLQFLHTAWASIAEVGYCLHAAHRLGYIDPRDYQRYDLAARRAAAPLIGLIRAQRRVVARRGCPPP